MNLDMQAEAGTKIKQFFTKQDKFWHSFEFQSGGFALSSMESG
jgi:hypothetical protein